MSDMEKRIQAKIHGKKVMVFSKSYCPYCSMAKKALKNHLGKDLDQNDYEVWEIENEADCNKIQAVLKKLTGASSVPRVFINGKCIGGGSEAQELESSGKLAVMLAS